MKVAPEGPRWSVVGLIAAAALALTAYGDLRIRVAELPRSQGAQPRFPEQEQDEAVPSCNERLTQDSLEADLGSHWAQVVECYQERLAAGAPLGEGVFEVTVQVGQDGHVTRVETNSAISDQELVTCVSERAHRWNFEPPTGRSCARGMLAFWLTPSAGVEPPVGNPLGREPMRRLEVR